MATRRTNVRVDVPLGPTTANGSLKHAQRPGSETAGMTRLDAPPPLDSPFLPTLLETILLAIYPGTLIVGSLFSTLAVDHERSPYLAHLQAYDQAAAPSYFAKKTNVFNRYFVKVGWAWVTLALALFVVSSRALGPVSWVEAPRRALTARRLRAALRWAALTGVWYAMTQGFFGAPLIDRGFRFSGGACHAVLADDAEAHAEAQRLSDTELVFTHAACRLAGGAWKGGHDISGHVFLLVMGSAMLWFEILPTVLTLPGLREARRVKEADGGVRSAGGKGIGVATRDTDGEAEGGGSLRWIVERIAVGVAGVSWWMLLMTAAYFHTWLEKLTGLSVAFAAIYAVYLLPRAIPALRQVLGMPGI